MPCTKRHEHLAQERTLTVYVEFTNERALGKSIEVRVYQRGQILFGESFTDERGRARFDQVPAGYYHVEVQGDGIEKTEGAEFEILDMEGSHTETVRAKPALDANAGDNTAPAGNGATVSATELKIPEKAQKEFDKGVDAFAAGDNKKAEESFNKAIEAYPKYANAYSNLGVLYIKLGQQAEGERGLHQGGCRRQQIRSRVRQSGATLVLSSQLPGDREHAE